MNFCYNTSYNDFLNASHLNKDFYVNNYEVSFDNFGLFLSATVFVFLVFDFDVFKKEKPSKIKSKHITIPDVILTNFLSLICLLISLIISPIIFSIFIICYIYRSIIHKILKYQYGTQFIDLLEGTDTVWAIEDISKSVINILILIQNEEIGPFTEKIKIKMSEIIKDEKFIKLQYFRRKNYGYYYWIKDEININEYINKLPIIETDGSTLNKQELLNILAELSNKSLPRKHQTSWEILVGQQLYETKHYPVLFRFHHSVGDGLALIKILLEASDLKTSENIKIQPQINKKTYIQQFKLKLSSIVQMFLSIVFVPGHLIHMNLIQKVDNNILHGIKLSGFKTLTWISENKDDPVLKIIKEIKGRFPGVTFLDVVLATLSEAFTKYFEENTNTFPQKITSVILERAEKVCLAESTSQTQCCQLQNRFTVGMVNLPILPPGKAKTGSHFQTIDRLQEVHKETNILKNASPDYQINYWLLKVVSQLLPEVVLKPMLHSAHSTMVVSNILGPGELTICDGFLIDDLIFWLPHRGLTGIGISILSYAEKLKIGIIADRALISSNEDAEIILNNFIKSVKILNKTTQKTVKYKNTNL